MQITLQNQTLLFQQASCFFKDLDAFFDYYLISRKKRYFYYQKQQVFINQIPVHQNVILKTGDTISIVMEEEQDDLFPSSHPIDIVYEDALCLIVNKPSHLLVHPDGTNEETLNHRIRHYYNEQQIPYAVRHLHRLDKDTSGLLMYCKLPFFQAYMDDLLQKKQISRVYYAIVEGIFETKKININSPIGKDRHHSKKQRVSKTGKPAHTTVLVKKQSKKRKLSLIECHLSTGRTHQIRVHLASIHHPLASDPLYGRKNKWYPRLALHAYKLRFYHPMLQQEIEVTCPLPNDMIFQ